MSDAQLALSVPISVIWSRHARGGEPLSISPGTVTTRLALPATCSRSGISGPRRHGTFAPSPRRHALPAVPAGDLALPPAHRDHLLEELTATSWTITGTGKIQITAKRDIKAKLGGASPDLADALAAAAGVHVSLEKIAKALKLMAGELLMEAEKER